MRERDRRWIVSLLVCLSAACDEDTMNTPSDTIERRSVFDAGGAGRVDATGQTCRLNSDCIPQLHCSDRRPMHRWAMPGGWGTCLSERCVWPGECRPPMVPGDDDDVGPCWPTRDACSSAWPCPEGTICVTGRQGVVDPPQPKGRG